MSEQKELNEGVIMKAMNFAYDKALSPIPGLDSAYDLANDYMKENGTLYDKANSLIRWQNSKASVSGFVTGLGGFVALPVALPANITSVLYIQIRMVAAIAIMGGYDPKDDRVKSLIYGCLVASSSSEIVKNIGVQIGQKLAVGMIKKIPMEVVKKINQAVAFKLVTKFGEKGIINLGKMIPFFGGLISALFDCLSTNTIGNVARDIFTPKEE